jgi:outer membrane protein assembly factor BamD (BamD/ComL family)
MSYVLRFAAGLLILAALFGGVLWLACRRFKRADDRFEWLIKAGLTLITLSAAAVAVPFFGIYGLFLIVGCSIAFSLLWAPSLGAWLVEPLTRAFDGGSEPPAPAPAYSIALARRHKRDFAGAMDAVREQLRKFPADPEGHMLLASIQAENLHDLDAAALTLERFINQKHRTPRDISFALTTLADWQLNLARDPDAARENFERIRTLLPATPFAQQAAQRIAHLGAPGQRSSSGESPRLTLPSAVSERAADSPIGAAAVSSETRANELLRHLAQHPHDIEAREELARHYGYELDAPDLALQQIDELLQLPHQPPRHVAHWLELKAELLLRRDGNAAAAQAALRQVVERYPNTALADAAERRMATLTLGFRPKHTGQALRLGQSDPDLGLKLKR